MRTIKLYDGKEEYILASFASKEQAAAFVSEKAPSPRCALFPSLSADIGMIAGSPLWGNAVTPEALRAVSYYVGILCGWPQKEISVACENGRILLLPLAKQERQEILQKAKICKPTFAKTQVFDAFVTHTAVEIRAENTFLLIESDAPNAVAPSTVETLRTPEVLRINLPICYALLSDAELRLRVLLRGKGEALADDLLYMHALAYFHSIGRTVPDRAYAAAGGAYRIRGSAAESLRTLSLVSSEGGVLP